MKKIVLGLIIGLGFVFSGCAALCNGDSRCIQGMNILEQVARNYQQNNSSGGGYPNSNDCNSWDTNCNDWGGGENWGEVTPYKKNISLNSPNRSNDNYINSQLNQTVKELGDRNSSNPVFVTIWASNPRTASLIHNKLQSYFSNFSVQYVFGGVSSSPQVTIEQQ